MQSQFSTASFEGFPRSRLDDDDSSDELLADDATGTDGDDDEDELELPVDPDEGMPVIPDDERVIDVPS